MHTPPASSFTISITAGTSYFQQTHQSVPVNAHHPLHLTSPSVTLALQVLIHNYHGLPKNAPSTHSYFRTSERKHDLYSLRMNVMFKEDVNGDDLVFGNDFDKSIWNSLPMGFSVGLNIIKYGIDPGLDGDVRGDKPYLYGPVLSSMNVINVSPPCQELPKWGDEEILREDMTQAGANGDGTGSEIPGDSAGRRKFFLKERHRKHFVFQKGRVYGFDFFNGFLDFNDFTVKLPGFSLQILKYWDGQPLRYVLKNRKTGEVYCAIVFTLIEKAEGEYAMVVQQEDVIKNVVNSGENDVD
ncbi:hypothetical protein RUND412_006883 [Rhizina undulata]